MAEEIKITKKAARKGDDGYKIVSVRMREEMLERLEELSAKTNRSRNELINLLLESAINIVKIEDWETGYIPVFFYRSISIDRRGIGWYNVDS